MDKPARRLRLFAGIALDDAARDTCTNVAMRLEQHGFEARYESPAKLHITLAFLGNVDAERAEEIERVVREVAASAASFDLTLDKLGAFPHERKPRIIYVGSREQGPRFRDLANRLRGAYRAIGFTFEDDAVAHVTIARVKNQRRKSTLPPLEVHPTTLTVNRLVLFESIPDRETTRYIERITAPLS